MSAGFHPQNVAPRQQVYPQPDQYYAGQQQQYARPPAEHFYPEPQSYPQPPTYQGGGASPCRCGDPRCTQGALMVVQQGFQPPAPQQSPGLPRKTSAPYTHSPYAQSLCSNDQEIKPHVPAGMTESFDSGSRSSVDDRQHSFSDDSSESECDTPSHHLADKTKPGGLVHITVEIINTAIGKVSTIAGSPHGSSFLQAALRQYPIEAFEIIYKEVAPVMGKLLLDKHACYVVKMVLEMMDKEEAIAHLDTLAANEELLLTLCTKDLHTRRMVQFILDFATGDRCRYLFDLVMRRPMEVVRTQQGCITLQRILDHFPAAEKEAYFATVRASFMEYALDPFGNYIIQYMLTEGNQVENSNTLALYCRGQLHNMICHKYASNVIEKCFGLVTPELQHDIIEEMFNAPEPTLMRVLTDSSANYVVQAAIRSASFRDVTAINNRIAPMLPHIQYGKKLQQRLARRLKQ